MSRFPSLRSASWLLLTLPLLHGCFGADSSPDGIIASYEDSQNQPFTDAYIEYPGPQELWAGPSSFILHVTTRDTATAQISISPAMFEVQAPKGAEKARKLASPPGMPADAAREELARLFTAMQGQEQTFTGCLYPVWVRMIRGDGTLVERRGCRGQAGWPRVASEVVNHFIESSVYAQILVKKTVTTREPAGKGRKARVQTVVETVAEPMQAPANGSSSGSTAPTLLEDELPATAP